MQPTSSETCEVTLTTLTYGGDAMGRLPDGRAVFVPFGLPGERVRVRLAEEKRGFARGELVEVLQAAPERIRPRCRHFGACGGCHYQHMPYEMQLEAKAGILRDQLQRIGKIENPPVRPMVASPEPWNYRNHVQFHLSRAGKLGYVRASAGSVLAIEECHLPETSINSLWPQLEFEPDADIERVSIRAGVDGELMLVLESDSPETPELEIEAGISVAHVFEENVVVIAGSDRISITVGADGHLPASKTFRVSAPSFFQVNTALAEKMIHHLLAELPVEGSTLLDVYCGVGLFSAFLAPKCRQLIGIESSAAACEDFAANLDEFDNVELYEDLAENVLPNLAGRTGSPTCVLVDPPRAGLERAALDAILRLHPKTIAYVSCDPSTLARDAARLISGGYRLLDVTPFDLFPQTYHIESISILEE
jgi:23S rRNA (uracil1939-C5)-methyltransferase